MPLSALLPPTAGLLTQVEKTILLRQSVFSTLCWVLSSALQSLCSLCLPSSLYSVTAVNLDHPQVPNTRQSSHYYLMALLLTGASSFKLLQHPHGLLLSPSAAPIFCWYVSCGNSTSYPVTQACRKGVILHPSPILNQLQALSRYLPNPFQIWYCLIIPSNTDLGCPYQLLESSCHCFLVVSLHLFSVPLEMYHSHVQPFWTSSNPISTTPCSLEFPVFWCVG